MRTLAAVVFFFAFCHAAIAQRAEVKEKGLDYRKLVEGLISPNRAIQCDWDDEADKATLSIPPNYDWKAQERIEANRKLLFDHCEEALPFLIEGCTDSRYSQTAPWSEDYIVSRSVGWVCSEIIASYVEVFRKDITFNGPFHWHQYNFVPRLGYHQYNSVTRHLDDTIIGKKEIQDWWRRHRGKSLRELQIEAFDWAIEKRKEEQERLSQGERDERISRDMKRLAADRARLSKSEKWLPPTRMWASIVSPRGRKVVPWIEKGQ
jgi:hypothetical protein